MRSCLIFSPIFIDLFSTFHLNSKFCLTIPQSEMNYTGCCRFLSTEIVSVMKGSIDEYLYTGVNRVNDYEKIVNSITVNDIRKFADDLFKQKNEVEVTMVSAENK